MRTTTKDYATNILKSDDATGRVLALVNSTGIIDLQGDLLLPGAWARVIREKQAVAVAMNHDIGDIRGKVLSLTEMMPGDPRLPAGRDPNAGALLVEAQLNMKTQVGRDLYQLIKDQDYGREWSVQFMLDEDGAEKDWKTGVRKIKEVSCLLEVSPVLMGASPYTATLAAKGAEYDLRAYDREYPTIRERMVQEQADASERTAVERMVRRSIDREAVLKAWIQAVDARRAEVERIQKMAGTWDGPRVNRPRMGQFHYGLVLG